MTADELRKADDRAVAERLGRPGLRPVLVELERRYSAGDDPVRLTLRDLGLEERTALADLLGLPRLPGQLMHLNVVKLAKALGCSDPHGLHRAVERLRGPLPNRRVQRAAADEERRDLWAWFAEEVSTLGHASTDADASLGHWLDVVRRDGVRGSIIEHRARLTAALVVLRALPTDGVSLAALADDVLGDPHALDIGRSCSRLVLSALAAQASIDPPSDAEGVRSLWETAGVVPDPLSSTVLMLGVPDRFGALERTASCGDDRPEPFVLTLSQLRRWPLRPISPSATIFVVENPSLLAEAATRLEGPVPPIVCSSGQPSVAVITALRQLATDGAQIRQHADFDPSGIAISRLLSERVGSVPWMMTARDYGQAVRRSGSIVSSEFSGSVPETPWDPELAPLMNRVRRPVFEEQLRHAILERFTT